jgi:hypothetical protein
MGHPHDENLIPLNTVDDSVVSHPETEVRWLEPDEELDTFTR